MRFIAQATVFFVLSTSPLLGAKDSPSQQMVIPKNSLSMRFQTAKAGDFIVSSYSKVYSLLFIREVQDSKLTLEEVIFPAEGIDLKTVDWQAFINTGPKASISWTMYQIDLSNASLLGCYSETKKGWIQLEDSEQFLTKLLFLNFEKVPNSQRRKIGQEPPPGEADHRAVWNPPLTILGKKINKPQFEVWRATWPKDTSELSGCRIELFFNQNTPNFAFPHWIEIRSTHYTFKQHVVDSGSSLKSPAKLPLAPSKKV